MPPAIRVVAICRDEEDAVGGFLDQFAPLTRDWCLLDTGSTDRTVAVARERGARVESTSFVDFASARNEALDRFGAGADWIVMLDLDERLDVESISHIAGLAASDAFDVCLAPLDAVHADGTRRVQTPKLFLFRNDPSLRWTFAVHEKLVGSMRQALVGIYRFTRAYDCTRTCERRSRATLRCTRSEARNSPISPTPWWRHVRYRGVR